MAKKTSSSKNSALAFPWAPNTSAYLKSFKPGEDAAGWAQKKGYSFSPDPKAGLAMVGQVQAYEDYQPSDQKGMSMRQVTRNVYGPGARPAPAQGQAAAAGQQAFPNRMKAWNDSIDSGTQSMMDSITKVISENQANVNLFMGTIGDLMKQINSAPQRKAVTPYAVATEETPMPAPTAQVSQSIARRQRPMNNSLTITPEARAMGTGLNIAI